MSFSHRLAIRFLVVLLVALVPTIDAVAQTVIAGYDFDNLFLNVTKAWGGGLDNRDGGPGNFFGIGSINNWPQAAGVPFSVIDESGTVFPTDAEGILSDVNSNRDNIFAVISNTVEISSNPNFVFNACWGFNTSSATGPVAVSIDMGQCSDGDSFGGFTDGYVLFEYQLNGGGPWITAFSCDPFDSTDSGFNYRNMDSGFDPVEAFVCQATGPGKITKISAENGLPSSNTILDKCPPTGSPGAGSLDTFITEIVGGTGAAAVEVRVTTVLPFEGFVFDNIKIIQVPKSGGVVAPTQVTPTRGAFVSGGVADLEESDNSDYSMRRQQADTQSRTEFEVKSISPTATPSTFEFTLEGAVFARSNVVQTIELFDYDTASWELVSTTDAVRSPSPDSVVAVAATGDLSRFVEAGTMCIEARIRYQSDSARQRFASNTDQAVWTIR